MWFLHPKRNLRQVALEIIEGLKSGTLVPDPPLGRDLGEALPDREEKEVLLVREPVEGTGLSKELPKTAEDEVISVPLQAGVSLTQGIYPFFVADPTATQPSSRAKGAFRAGYRDTGIVVVARGARQEMVRHALV